MPSGLAVAWADAPAFDEPRSTHAAGSASKDSSARLCSEATQPATSVMPWAIGANTNWPNEPPALTMPVAMPRRSGGISRVVAAISTDGPAMPAPPADSTPIASTRPQVVCMYGTSAVPMASSTTPATSTRPAPMRSATMPASGCVKPHQSWPNANARLMLASAEPRRISRMPSMRGK